MPEQEQGTAIEKQLDRVREALLKNEQAIVLVVPDEFHRHIAQKAFEKQAKNAQAATGTVSAIVDAEDVLITRSIAALQKLHQIANNARPAQHQLDGTPMGAALEEQNGKKTKRGGAPKQVGEILDFKWADDVPQPRPKVGELLRVPTGETTSLEAVWGYVPEIRVGDQTGAFEISDTTGWRGFVYAHNGEWRLLNQRDQYTDTVEPDERGDVGVNAAQFDAALAEAAGSEQYRAAGETDTAVDDVLFPENAEGLDEDEAPSSDVIASRGVLQSETLTLPTQDEIDAEKKRTQERKPPRVRKDKGATKTAERKPATKKGKSKR